MKLPNGESALVEEEKVTGYLLNPLHPVGGPKARLFNSLLGLNLSNWQKLYDALIDAAENGDAFAGRASAFGQKYDIRFQMTGPRGTYTILSIWIVASGTSIPRLVTSYIE